MIDRIALQDRENEILAPYAARSKYSRGRSFAETPHPYRSEFQRDRERIIHSKSFRRLEYKTQVFVNHEGDHYRTRLTHTIEVAQIARTIARALQLNEDLAESIALAHDLGHPPFGHSGEQELNKILKDSGGFEHNRQSLKVIDKLEERYSDFPGLNLTWETKEGIIKHSSYRHYPEIIDIYSDELPSLEAQIIDIADEIAYNNHDLDDGINSGLLNLRDISKLRIWNMAITSIKSTGILPETSKLMVNKIIRTIINLLVTDLIIATNNNIKDLQIKTYMDVKKSKKSPVEFTNEMKQANLELKDYLNENLYQHNKVIRTSIKTQKVIRDLFNIYYEYPKSLTENYFKRIEADGLKITISDYIAGMTDRFALEEHKKLTEPTIRV